MDEGYGEIEGCPYCYCKNPAFPATCDWNDDGMLCWVGCTKCAYTSPNSGTVQEAITVHNRVAGVVRLAREFCGDQRTLDDSGFNDNYTDAARARQDQGKAVKQMMRLFGYGGY